MKSPTFLRGGGEMGGLMRSIDWSRTPLGRTRDWPQSLRTTVSTCLNSRFPILIWWGPQFVKLYNDAYRPMLGAKHPRAMGARNPLAPILLAVKMLDVKSPDDPSLRRLCEVIRRQAMQMVRLVDDLLDLGRIITGKLVLEHERVELNAIRAEAVETCTPFIQQRRHALKAVFHERPVTPAPRHGPRPRRVAREGDGRSAWRPRHRP